MLSSTSDPREVRIAARASPLAQRQALLVADLLQTNAGYRTSLVVVRTAPDVQQSVPLRSFGGRGIFTAEVSRAVLEGTADIAVHSAKDLPSSSSLLAEGLVIGAVPERGDPRDALVGCRLEELRPGATIATGSVRRRAQLAWLRPDLGFTDLRGNIATRLERIPQRGAVVVALVALQRLELEDEVGEHLEVLEPETMLSQVGQGALAVECRAEDLQLRASLAAHVNHGPSHRAVTAERAFLATLGGGCDAPVGALATTVPGEAGDLRLEGLIASADGHVVARLSRVGSDPEALGAEVAGEMVRRVGSLLSPEAL